jgi:hypothetical protein
MVQLVACYQTRPSSTAVDVSNRCEGALLHYYLSILSRLVNSYNLYYTLYLIDANLLAGWLATHPNGVKSAVSIFQPGLAWSFWAHAGVLVEGKLQ